MVNRDLLAAKLVELADRIGRVRTRCPKTLQELEADRDALDLVAFNLMVGVQSAAAIASHLIADEGWPAATTLAEGFDRLAERGVVASATARAAGTDENIFTALATVGFTKGELERGWALLRAVCSTTVVAYVGPNPAAEALAKIEAWRGPWFRRARAALRHLHAEAGDFVFHDLGDRPGLGALEAVMVFLSRSRTPARWLMTAWKVTRKWRRPRRRGDECGSSCPRSSPRASRSGCSGYAPETRRYAAMAFAKASSAPSAPGKSA